MEIPKPAPSPTFQTWKAMIQRCTNPKSDRFKYYGGRGIVVCPRWRVFKNFLEDMGDRPAGKTIERKDNDGNYEPGNCRWATSSEQHKNMRPASNARLTPDLVRHIRSSIVSGESQASVARRMKLPRSHVARVWHRKIWAAVP